jgi:hypothetical protein
VKLFNLRSSPWPHLLPAESIAPLMKQIMVLRCHHTEVFRAVIVFHKIDVVNDFEGEELPLQNLLRNLPVLEYWFSVFVSRLTTS